MPAEPNLAGRDLLTPQQLRIIVLAAQGRSNAEIGKALHISGDTVKTHIRAIFDRLGARNRAHCVHLAHRYGLAEVATADLNAVQSSRRTRAVSNEPRFERVGLTLRAVQPAARQREVADVGRR